DSRGGGSNITGTSLKDAFKVLSAASQEKLQSLTLKRSSREAEILVQAMSLITLRKGQDALDKLAALGGSGVAKYLAEQVTACRGQLEHFRIDEQAKLEARTDTLAELARIFQVLAEGRLCSESLRDRAYGVALGAYRSMNSNVEGRENRQLEQLMEEATMICGPEFITQEDGQFSWGKTLQSCSPKTSTHRGQHKKTSAIPIQGSQCGPLVPTVEHSSPTSLRSSSSNETSFPSHLEVSASPTAVFDSNRMTILHSPYNKKVCDFVENNKPGSATPGNVTNISRTTSPPLNSKDPEEQKEDEVEDEVQFFSFVILHAPEDMETAERLQEKLKSLGIGEGSTFSQDFLVPGKTKLRCIEDAIDNSAFSILLLSRNFNNQLQEIQTNAALMNSIENVHKYNSVIPLFPSKNRLPTEDMPKCLKIFVALEESSRSFDRMARMAMAPERIKKQKELWRQDQYIRLQQKRKLRLKEEIKKSKVLSNQEMEISQLEKEQRQLYMKMRQQNQTLQYYDTPGQPSILISNAKYIMIGDNSQMTVDVSSDTDDNDYRAEEYLFI
uniref:TIR domain containing adaptor molecule 1 n=1 Tax=Paramormyrops kingsleyae TaxID=1676925 RepID=A0A3B3SUQ7_9TELE